MSKWKYLARWIPVWVACGIVGTAATPNWWGCVGVLAFCFVVIRMLMITIAPKDEEEEKELNNNEWD